MQMTETQLTLLEQNGRVLAYVPAIFMNGYGLQAERPRQGDLRPPLRTRASSRGRRLRKRELGTEEAACSERGEPRDGVWRGRRARRPAVQAACPVPAARGQGRSRPLPRGPSSAAPPRSDACSGGVSSRGVAAGGPATVSHVTSSPRRAGWSFGAASASESLLATGVLSFCRVCLSRLRGGAEPPSPRPCGRCRPRGAAKPP